MNEQVNKYDESLIVLHSELSQTTEVNLFPKPVSGFIHQDFSQNLHHIGSTRLRKCH